MALAVVVVLLVVGSVIFHFTQLYGGPWYFTDIAADWGTIDLTINITFWVTGFVFVVVNLFMAWCVYKYRQKDGHKAVYEPENHKLEVGLTAFTTVGVIAMLAPGLFVWAQFVTVPEEAIEYEVLGQQWQWQFRYPGADGQLGFADVSHVSESNPFGINPEDPAGQDDVVVNDPNMHLAVNQPVHALLRSNDVLHNYTVPQFRVKMDMVPGLVSYLWFDPTKEGTYDILCEELCGIGHFIMRGSVKVESQAEFNAWISSQPTFAETQSMAAPNIAAGQAAYTICATCHGAQGEGNSALNGPKLAGQRMILVECSFLAGCQRAATGRPALGRHQILDRGWDTVDQSGGLALGPSRLRRLGGRQRAFGVDHAEGVKGGVMFFNAGQDRLGRLDGREGLGRVGMHQFGRGKQGGIGCHDTSRICEEGRQAGSRNSWSSKR